MFLRPLLSALLILLFAWPAGAFEDPEVASQVGSYRYRIDSQYRDQSDAEPSDKLWGEARRLATQSRWPEAIKAFERAIASDGDQAELWLELSEAWAFAPRLEMWQAKAAAFEAYRLAKTDGLKARALFQLGQFYEKNAQYDEAIEALGEGLTHRRDPWFASHRESLVTRYAMRLVKAEAEPESERPRICLAFSRNLQERGPLRYEDYVRLEPEVEAVFTAREKRLCIEGVAHGVSYKVTLRKGLPDAAGHSLATREQFAVVVPDRQPSIAFRGAAHILPREGNRELPLDSVNVGEVQLRVLRINDRNLIQEINQGRIDNLLSYSDARRMATLDGELIWQGTLEIESEPNRQVTTAVPVSELLEAPEPGIYAVTAISKEITGYSSTMATQWLLVSDIGMSSYRGSDGLGVFLRSLETAQPLAGVDLVLAARSNEVLARAVTDAAGAARFDPGLLRGSGGARPGAVMAFTPGGDFNFLDLTQPAFDLTDRGVGGREAPGPIDAYLYSERGIYRPGATVQIVALLRDDRAEALTGLPLQLRVYRPDGTEHRRFDLEDEGQVGGYRLALPLAQSARTGQWTLRAYVDPEAAPVGLAAFQVEDFVPERLDVELTPDHPQLEPGVDNAVDVAARFLYGAPAADLRVDGEIVLRQDMNPYPARPGYKFGLVQEEWRARRQVLPTVSTDAQGRARLVVRLDELPQTSRPLRAVVRASINEAGGRAVVRSVSLPLRGGRFAIGIKPRFGERPVERGQEAGFQIIAVGRDGEATAATGLVYELFREHYRYRWYSRSGRWDYKVLVEDELVEFRDLALNAEAPAELAFQTDWGYYRLEVSDPQNGIATSVRYRVGWFTSQVAADVPDKLEITLDKDSYRAGDTAKVHIRAPFAGEVLLTVAGDRLYSSRDLSVAKGGTTVELAVEEDWLAGVYVTATLFRPGAGAGAGGRGPSRAIGLAWLARDMSDRTFGVTIEGPEKITPRQTVEFAVQVAGMTLGEPAFVTLAAVDEGILQLTDFASPAPEDHYYGKRRLAVELRDHYGRLIQSAEGHRGRLRQGGDADAARHLGGLDASSIKTVALFSGIVRLDDDGRARIAFEIPDFNGRLRLMAVAFDGRKVGHGESALVVRDALVSQITLPRFMAPRDKSLIALRLHNLEGPTGSYRLTFEASGAAGFSEHGRETVFELAPDARRDVTATLTAAGVGVARIAMRLEGPEGYLLERDWELAVRPAQTLLTRRLASRLQPGERITISDELFERFVPDSGELVLTLSARPVLQVAELLRSLSRYPYGCAEQTTSGALPLLYVSDVARSIGVAEDETAIRSRVQGAINRLMGMQRGDGAFGLWGPWDAGGDWLSAYVMDFLTQARKKDYFVPDLAYKRGLARLSTAVSGGDFRNWELPARTYAAYVLAQAEQARLADLRYLHDTYLDKIPTAIGRAQLGAALALYGDTERAQSAFGSLRIGQRRDEARFGGARGYWDYGSNLRDVSAVTYLSSLDESTNMRVPEMMDLLTGLLVPRPYTSTQEKAWILLLASRFLEIDEDFEVAIDGGAVTRRRKPLFLEPDAGALSQGLTIENRGDQPIWQYASISGVPAEEQPAEANSFAIKRSFFTLDGEVADLQQLRQSDSLVVVIEGEATSGLEHQALIVDLLPAGFEIENQRLDSGRDTAAFGWLPELTQPRYSEPRDDRFVAALDLQANGRKFAVAYVVRAVTPGNYRLPAPYVEDMYKPNFFARGAMGVVKILPRQ